MVVNLRFNDLSISTSILILGYCNEIYDLKCERKCDSKEFLTEKKNSVMFIGERLIMANCARRSTNRKSNLDEG